MYVCVGVCVWVSGFEIVCACVCGGGVGFCVFV